MTHNGHEAPVDLSDYALVSRLIDDDALMVRGHLLADILLHLGLILALFGVGVAHRRRLAGGKILRAVIGAAAPWRRSALEKESKADIEESKGMRRKSSKGAMSTLTAPGEVKKVCLFSSPPHSWLSLRLPRLLRSAVP